MLNGQRVLETLAALEHEQWMSWAKAIAPSLDIEEADAIMPRWNRLWVPYDKLPEEEKEKDRTWARRVLQILNREMGR
jgi:hypothetical protein